MTKPFSYEEAAAPRTESFSYEDASGEPPKPASAMRKLGDLGLGFASGAVGATKAIADAAGAGNKASSVLSSLNTGINDYLSPAAKADQQEQGKILADASGKGTWEGVKAGARAFGVAPVQTAVQGIGSIVPILAGTALTGGAVPAAVVGAGIGAAMGAGTAKGAIYDEIKKRGGTEEEAIKAQEYGGANTDQIALGGALGTADALTGVSKMAGNMARNAMGKPVLGTAKEASRGIVGRSAMGMLSEMPLEAAQGGQEQVAANIAAQRAGYQAGTWDNVASNATMESLASAGPGAAFGAMDTGKKTLPPVAPPPAVPPAPPADPMLALPAPSIVVGPDGTATTAQDRNARLSRIADGDITDVTPIQKPSEQMGIDPAAGVISAVAAQAVDNGHAQEIQQAAQSEQDQATYDQAMAEQDQAAQEQDSVDKPITSGPIAEAQMSDEDKRAVLFSNQAVGDGGLRFEGTQDGDILNGMAAPFATRLAAARRANMEGKDWTIAPVFDGWVARRKDAFKETNAQNTAANDTAPETQAEQTPQAVGANTTDVVPAVPAVPSVPAGNTGNPAVEGDAVTPRSLPPTDIRLGNKVIVDGKPYTVTQGIEGGIAVESESVDIGNGVSNSETKFLKGDDAIRAKIAADEAGLNLQAVDPKRQKALDRIAKGTAYFGSYLKASNFIADNGLKDTHMVAKHASGANRYDIKAKIIQPQEQTSEKAPKAIEVQAKPEAGPSAGIPEPAATAGVESADQAVAENPAEKQWTRTTTAEREAIIAKTDIKPLVKRNIVNKAWAELNGDIQKKLAKAMEPAAATENLPEKPKYEGLHMASGRAAFAEGKPRILPSYFTKPGDKNSKDWYRGWDAANSEAPVSNMQTADKQELQPLTKALNDLMEVRQRIADQGQVVDDRLLSRERQLKALVKELESDGQQDELDAEMRSYEAKAEHTFVKAPDGSTDFGEITPEMSKAMRRQAGKIRLQQGNAKFGLTHIENRHGKEIRDAGFASVQEFVADIAKHIDKVLAPDGNSQLIAVHSVGNDRVMFIELQSAKDDSGDYYTVNTAYQSRSGYADGKKAWKVLWEGRAQPSLPAASEQAPFAESPQNADKANTIPSGQSDASLAPAEPEVKATLSEKEKAAKAKMFGALGKLAALASKNTRMNWTPEEEQALLPIVIELFDGAMELGAVTFQKAVAYVRDFIANGIDKETADAIPFETLQGAYIHTARKFRDQGATSGKEVMGFDSLAELEKTAEPAQKAGSLTDKLSAEILGNNMPKDNPALKKLVEAFDGKPADQNRMKEAQEALEAAIVNVSRDIVAKKEGTRTTFDVLLRLYQSQPNLNIRTSTSIANQAYSTPAPLAYLGSVLADVTKKTSMYEPTGGNGMLTINALPANVTVNELEPGRIAALKEQGFAKVLEGDALKADVAPKSQDRVMTNPPFGSVKNDKGEPVKVSVDGYKIGQIDHLIAARALETLKDDGKATLIIGANKVAGGLNTDDRIFFNWLYGNYNVTSHFEVEGDLYQRQGAGWPVRVITINGRQKSDRVSPVAGTIQRAQNWEQVYEHFTASLDSSRTESQPKPSASTGGTGAVQAGLQPVRESVGKPNSKAGGLGQAGGAVSPGNVAGASAGNGTDSPERVSGQLGDANSEQRLHAESVASNRLDPAGDGIVAAPAKPARNPGATALSSAENQFQVTYEPRSARKDGGVLIPVNMKDPTQDALSRLEDAVGDIDAYAAKELGYPSTDALHEALMGLQVDSVASAIYQIGQGKGVVIADQTGIGKGRQAAAVIRWAERNGHIPVFVSVKPSLFTDMFGDLHDIGSDNITPFILNKDESIKGPGGEKLFANRAVGHRQVMEKVRDTGKLPGGANAIFMTYSQVNTDNVQRQMLTAIADRAVFILDESHNAGGQSNTGEFVTSLLEGAKGVTYLSATYAKRPDNMPLYFKTDIGQAAADNEGLMQAMANGGLPLQTVVSNNLVKAGQMFRRERSYDGVSIETIADTDHRVEHEKLSDETTKALRAIVAADRMFHHVFVKQMNKDIQALGGAVIDNAGNQAQAGVDHTQFSSVVHNFVKQMLLGLKAQRAADDAIASLKRNEKPIIAVENTMGSFLDAYAKDNGVSQGGSLGTFDYRTVLSRALARTLFITEVKPNGEKVKKEIKLSQLDSETRAAYDAAQQVIDGLKLDIPVSPIDWMRNEIHKAGYKVAEITGRNLAVDYSNPKKPVLGHIDQIEQDDKVRTTQLFNAGQLDALILNVAGSTGISLHASEKFQDKRQRHMIIGQAAGDINIFMQMLGRIHRTGQVVLPKYSILSVDLPTEKRPTAVLSGKMKSLNANTSSNTDSATSIKTVDMFNKYGDQVVAQYLQDNYALARDLGVEDLISGDAAEDLAQKTTGRLALQPIAVQNAFYEEVEAQYSAMMDYLNKTNQNDLEPRTFDYDARETRQEVLFEGENKDSPFGEDAIYGEYSIKAQGKAMTPAEIREAMTSHLDGKNSDMHMRSILAPLVKQFDDYIATLEGPARDSANATRATGQAFMVNHSIGDTFRVDINGDSFNAVVTNIRNTHKANGNPFSLSKIQVTIALNGALRSITVPASQFQKIEVSAIGRGYSVEQLFKEQPANQRETAKIVTGNLLAAYGEIQGARGTIITFTKQDGTTEQGILLPKAFDFKNNTRGDYRLATGEDALKFLQNSENKDIGRFGIQSRDGVVRVLPAGRGIAVLVPKSKLKGGKYFLDKGLIDALGDFVTSGSAMKAATYDGANAVKALDLLMKKNALYAIPSMAEEAKALTGDAGNDTKFAIASNGSDAYTQEDGNAKPTSDDHAKVKRLSEIVSRALDTPEPNAFGAYRAVSLPGGGHLRAIAAAFGKAAVGYRLAPVLKGQKSPFSTIGGVSTGAIPNTVFLNIDSGRPHLSLLGHELAHELKRDNPALYSELVDAIRPYINQTTYTLEFGKERVARDLAQRGDAEGVREEFIGEVLSDGFTETAFWNALGEKSPSLLGKIVGAVGNLIDKVRRTFGLQRRTAKYLTDFDRVMQIAGEAMAKYSASAKPATSDVRFNRTLGETLSTAANNVHDVNLPAGYTVGDLLKSAPGKLNWWHKTVGTMYNLAERSLVFKRVYDAVQNFINDVSYYATEAADLAPNILPKLETWKDIGKSPLSAADTKAISAPIFEGTLVWARDESGKPIKLEELEAQAASLTPEQKAQRLLRNDKVSQQVLKMWQGLPLDQYESIINGKYERDMLKAGVVWTDAELKSMFNLTDAQISLYREFRKSTDKSLTNLAISDMLRFGGKDTAPIREMALEAGTAMEAGVLLRDYLLSLADADPARSAVLIDTANKMIEKADKAQDLIARGYAPLSRYGQYTLDVVDANGERVYFGMFESKMDAARMARRMEQEYPGATMTRGTVSEEEYKLFAGVSPETLELFGDMLGLEAQGDSAASKAFQTYLKLAKSNRSSMKRMIQRKGIAGFSEDAGRVLAGFVYSNARQTASNLHMGEMTEAANEVSKTQGELKDQAVRLVDYVKNPREEAQAFRGLLFAQYIGGSVASAMVNMTQPITMTFPWLSQFGGPASAAKHLTAAMKDANKKLTGDAKLDAALKRAEEDGTVSPQEVHQLMQQAQGRGTLRSGDGTKAGDALATANNALSKFSLGWGKLFSLAEQFNRRSTFIAAYRVAVEQGVKDPDTFARKAIAETQGVYNKGNKPAWARGAIGSTLFTFKQYSVAYTEMLHRMATQGGPEGKKAALLALGVLFLMSGAGGLPGGDDLDDLISFIMQRLGYNFDSKAKRKEFFASVVGEGGAQFLEHGVSGLPGMPLDVSGRLGMGNLIPGTGLLVKKADHTRDLAEIAGPAGDFGKRIFEAAGKTLDGDVLGLNGAVRTVAPKAFQNLYQSYDMANLGMYRDAKGMKVLDTDGMDATLKAIGFQPNDVKKVQDASFESQRMIGLNKLRESEIANRWALGIFEKDTDKVKAAREELAEWNATNPESQIRINFKQILQRVGKMNQTKAERIAATAPKEIRADVQRALAVQ